MEAPSVSRSVQNLLAATYLTDDEKKELRITHGVWSDADLDTPSRRARAAVISGRFRDVSIDDETVPAVIRAEGLLGRGDADKALALLDGDTSLRAARLRAQALWDLGRLEDARTSLEATRTTLMSTPLKSAADVADAVRAMVIFSRLTGDVAPPPPGVDAPKNVDGQRRAADFKMFMSILARAREELSRLEPSIYLAEAELLEEKENYTEASQAISQALELCPKNTSAWALFGRMMASSWDFERALAIAARLDVLAVPEEDKQFFIPRSVSGGEIAARTFLRQKETEAAEAALIRALELAPRNRTLLALHAAVAAASYSDDRIAKRVAAFEELSPNSPDAYYEIGTILSDLRQYEESETFLTEARRRAPMWAAVQAELGLLQVQAGRDKEALETLSSAAALDPFNVRVANSLKLVAEIMTYERVTSDHFEIRYKPGIDAILAKEMLPVMEKNFERVTGNGPGGIDFVPKNRTVIELYPDHQWFSVRITGVRQVHTIAAATGPVIAMERPMSGPGHSIGSYDWPRVLRHEYTHTVTLGRTKNRLPHWFTEAGAVYLEDAPRDENRCTLLTRALETGGLLDFSQINIAFVRPRTPTERGLAYAQGHWMYEYIVERFGARAPLNLMDRYAKGEREADAFVAELGRTREQFFEEFKTWARGECMKWGTLPPEGMPTVLELMEAEARNTPPTAPGESPSAQPSLEPTPELIESWLALHPKHPDLLRLAVGFDLAENNGEATEAMIPMLERLATARPIDHMPHKQLARLYLASSDPARAIPHLEYLDAREQYQTTFAIELAKRYAARKDWQNAGLKAERAVSISPFEASIRELAATIAIQTKDFTTARRHIEALIAIEPDREVHKKRLEALEQRAGQNSTAANGQSAK
jgi:tetratricopeptide (TPR) repeat protein